MDGASGRRFGSFLIGGLVGSVAGVAAAGRMHVRARRAKPRIAGLAAFEQAPCFREIVEHEELDAAAPDEDEAAPR